MSRQTDKTILSALMNGIKTEGPLMAELARRPTLGTLQQFMKKAEKFINQEETISALTKAKTRNPHDRSDGAKEEKSSLKKKRKDARSPKHPRKRPSHFKGKIHLMSKSELL
jgi:hypothetical protein